MERKNVKAKKAEKPAPEEKPEGLEGNEAPVQEETKEEKNTPVEEVPAGEKRILFKKLGGGSLRIKVNGINRIIKQNEKFWAKWSEIPLPHRDTVAPTDATEVLHLEETPVVAGKKSAYNIVPRGKSKYLFDVVDGQGKRLNDTPLARLVAEGLKKDLEK